MGRSKMYKPKNKPDQIIYLIYRNKHTKKINKHHIQSIPTIACGEYISPEKSR